MVDIERENLERHRFTFSVVKIWKDTDLHSQLCSSYCIFFGSCCYKTETFCVNLCFDLIEERVQTADDNNKATSHLTEIIFRFHIRY